MDLGLYQSQAKHQVSWSEYTLMKLSKLIKATYNSYTKIYTFRPWGGVGNGVVII